MTDELIKKIESLSTIELNPRAKDLSGKRQGQIIFLKPSAKKNNRIYWWTLCDCGNIEEVRADSTRQACSSCIKQNVSKKLKNKPLEDLTGQRFGRLTVLTLAANRKNNHLAWHCRCDCGNELDVITASLTTGNTQSCGCYKKDQANFKKLKNDLSGQRFGYLTVLRELPERKYGKVVWECQCDCGNIVNLVGGRLLSGNDTSCGCKKQSLGMLNIEKILKNNNINYIKEFVFSDLTNRRYDFALIDKTNTIYRLIEFDGEQHYRATGGWNDQDNLEKNKQHDKEKNEYALSHNIPLVRIPYWERDNITLDMLLGDKYLVK